MGLSNELVSQFAKITKDTSKTKSESTVYGTTVEYEGSIYVRLDGSELLTPVSTTTDMKPGERVIVLIKNHSATVTGNVSSPSARTDDVKEVKNKTEELGNQISEFEIIVADKVSTSELEAERGRIDELVSDNVIIREKLTAAEADIGNLEADNVIINEKLIANEAIINDLEVKKLDAEQADIKYATVENLEATNADLYNLEATYAEFEVATINKLNAHDASIENLEVKKLDAEQAEIKYANIDFANIGEAAIENFYAKSGVIQDVVISDGQVTGTLVGVTIKGDLIEGGTVVADKLVIKGEDGLYYKLNTDGESVSSEQTEYNSLSGTIITAKSVTAEKIAVDDLVAFDATIGGFKINDHSIYSGVKESVNNTTRGIYFGSDAQFAIGDSSQYLKYFKDTDGNYKLEIFAKSITIGTSGKSVEDSIDDLQNETQTLKETTITNTVEEFYKSNSPTELTGGSWSTSQPTWTEGTYIWRRTLVTYGDGSTEYTPSTTGVCITGSDGRSVSSITTEFYLSTSKTTQTGGSWVTAMPEWVSGKYLWTRSKIVYSNPSGTEYTEPTCDSSWEAVNEIQVGGRNYIRNSNFVSELFNWSADSGDVYIESNNDISYLKFIPSGGNKLIMYGVSDFWNKDQEYSYSFIAKKANSVIRISDFLVEGSSYRSMIIDSVSENAITINCTNTPSFSHFSIDLTEELISGVTYKVSYTCSGKKYSVLIDEASDSSFSNITKSSVSSVTVSSGKFYRLKIYGNNTSAASTESYINTYTNISLLPENKSVSITPSRSIADFGDVHSLTETWTSYSGCIKSTATATGGTLSISADNIGVPILITKLKLEIGNKATDWSPAPEDVDNAIETKGEELGQVIIEQTESAKEAANAYTDESLKGYVDNDRFVTVEKDINARLDVLDENVTINIESVTKQITAVNDELHEKYNVMVKYFEFGENGLIIGLTDSPYKSVMDNDRYSMVKNDVEVLWFDGDGKGHIPELTLIKEFNLFGLLFDKDESNNINAEYAGEVDSFLLSIVQHPQDASVSVGETAIFNVYATGYNLSYQWQYMQTGSSVWKDSTKAEAKTKKFTITPANTSVNGQKIRCKITDGYENVVYSDIAIITVTE